jgi:hypothetical protein
MVLTATIIRPNAGRQRLAGIYDVMDRRRVLGRSACVSLTPCCSHPISSNVLDKRPGVPVKQSLNGGFRLVGQYKIQWRVPWTYTTRRREPDPRVPAPVIDRAAKRILSDR